MECKGIRLTLDSKGFYTCINRNILECKAPFVGNTSHSACVLIETYWNVKEDSDSNARETLLSITRNILECKGWISNKVRRIPSGINRNILECKGFQRIQSFRPSLCINRNILECKGQKVTYFHVCPGSINRNILECKE